MSLRHRAPDPAQKTLPLDFEEALHREGATMATPETALAALTVPPAHLPLYTVCLRRSAVISVAERPQLISAAEAAALLWDYLKETDREHFVVLFLDSKNQVVGVNTVSIGILDSYCTSFRRSLVSTGRCPRFGVIRLGFLSGC
jgi:hypothetical protein